MAKDNRNREEHFETMRLALLEGGATAEDAQGALFVVDALSGPWVAAGEPDRQQRDAMKNSQRHFTAWVAQIDAARSALAEVLSGLLSPNTGSTPYLMLLRSKDPNLTIDLPRLLASLSRLSGLLKSVMESYGSLLKILHPPRKPELLAETFFAVILAQLWEDTTGRRRIMAVSRKPQPRGAGQTVFAFGRFLVAAARAAGDYEITPRGMEDRVRKARKMRGDGKQRFSARVWSFERLAEQRLGILIESLSQKIPPSRPDTKKHS